MLFFILVASAYSASLSADYRDNPGSYYRDPCPDSRPGTKCNEFDEYVWRKDENYKWEIVETYTQFSGVTGYAILLHSQKWLDDSIYYIEREGPGSVVWSHWVNVWIPTGANVDKELIDSAILFVDGGKNSAGPPSLEDKYVKLGRFLCSISGLVYVNIKQIPNEKLIFHNDWKSSRTEDGIIALTWRHFLDYPEQPEWLLRFPMVKACLRAMDMTSELMVSLGSPVPVERWSVLGGSKRGWTSWMVAVADPERVVAVAPIVLDLLNMRENLHHMWRNTGNWSFTFSDYWMEELLGRLDEPNFQLMAEYIDPFFYKERLTMPKMIISSCGDEFFMPDDSHYFFDQLPGPKYMRLLPNAEHSTAISGLSAPHFAFSFRQFVLATLKGYPLPQFTWNRWDDPEGKKGGIELITETPVKSIYGWVGDTRSNFRRDFRLAGVRNNQKGNTLKPDYPDLPEGYPDKSPNKKKFIRQLDLDEIEEEEDKMNFTHSAFDPEITVPFIDQDDLETFQLQLNFWNKVQATQVGYNRWRLEFHEATNAYRGFFFQVQFQGVDDIQSFEFTSEVQIIPAAQPFEDCSGIDCQGSLV